MGDVAERVHKLHLQQDMSSNLCSRCGMKLSSSEVNLPRVYTMDRYTNPIRGYVPCTKTDKPKDEPVDNSPEFDPSDPPF